MRVNGVTLRDARAHLSVIERAAFRFHGAYGALADAMDASAITRMLTSWASNARPDQIAPKGDWRCWLILAGRGFGKTRAGAEWVRGLGETAGAFGQPSGVRIALVAATMDEARSVMVEGPSGVMAVSGSDDRPSYEPSLRRLSWPSGVTAMLYSAAEPDSLRGGEFDYAWADEIAKWAGPPSDGRSGAEAAWDNLRMALRAGRCPRLVATTTPRPVALVRKLVKQAGEPGSGLVLTRGASAANAANLPSAFLAGLQADHGGTRLGRQELDGELIDDVAGALWNRAMFEINRTGTISDEQITRVVVAIDPPGSANGDACGIIAAARLEGGRYAVLEDASAQGCSPEGWARAAVLCAARHRADRIVAEANMGGDMVGSVLRAVDSHLPVRLVHASRSKAARAEPIAALYEQGRVSHAGGFADLEDQLCGMMAAGGYMGPGRSPDRADALVWALTELSARQSVARVRVM